MATAQTWLNGLEGVRAEEPLAHHTTYRIGGPAERYLEVGSTDDLGAVVVGCSTRGIPLLALGNGSNVLIADGGVAGLVVRPLAASVQAEGNRIVAAAGARMVRLAQAAAAQGLAGMEWALGIPGTVGGSVYNNAGCFGSDVAATVASVTVVGPGGAPEVVGAERCAFRYRGSSFREGELEGHLVAAAAFDLQRDDPASIKARMDDVQRQRKETQPVSGRSTGSVFKNPPGDFAGRLVEAAGLKGHRIGGAMVSREHANFIVNASNASAADVAALVQLVQKTVADQFAVSLELEMEPVGRWEAGAP